MLSEEEFVDTIMELQTIDDYISNLEKITDEYNESLEGEHCSVWIPTHYHKYDIIHLLGKLMEDMNEDILYFVDDLNYGRLHRGRYMAHSSRVSVPLKDAHELYHHLVGQMGQNAA